jgi:hypothetical protein
MKSRTGRANGKMCFIRKSFYGREPLQRKNFSLTHCYFGVAVTIFERTGGPAV